MQTSDVLARFEYLEERVDTLEQIQQEVVGDELVEALAKERDGVTGVEKSGHGEWAYASDEAAREQLRE